MSTELERQLDGFLAEAPEPSPGVGERALARSIEAVRPEHLTHRRLRTTILALAAALAVLVAAAGSLAAVGALHVSFSKQPKPRAARESLALPAGTDGVAVVVDGKLSLVTKSGFRLQGLPVSAAALSPHALYVAAGIGDSLVAMAPDGRRAWSRPAGGRIVAIAWAPDGFRIAYVVRGGRQLALHVIWGNGTHDEVVARGVRPVRPSWRADSLAVAYVGAGGRAIVYDVGHRSRHVVLVEAPVTGIAFAPAGDVIAVGRTDGVWLLHESGAREIPGKVEAFGWLRGRLAVALSAGRESTRLEAFAADGSSRGSSRPRGAVVAVTPTLVVVRRGRRLVAGDAPLATLRTGAAIREVEIG